MTYDVTVLASFHSDLAALPLNAQKRAALVLTEIRDGDRVGQPLGDLPSVGDLSDCFKVYFDPDPRVKPRYRLVYRLVNRKVSVVGVQAVAVGHRDRLDAYVRAAKNLGRGSPS